ncbi:MAG: aldehyde reductase, partial [Sphingomonadales bacterium]
LVTGGSGFVGSHVILQLLEAGHLVRTTIRNPAREAEVRAMLESAGADISRLGFAVADLEKDAGWAEAAADCDFVQHVASPFPITQPKDEQELIRPAVNGTLRVLRAARDAGVKRVVLTSSFAAIGYGHGERPAAFTEADWTDVNGPAVQPYMKSKMLAERAAWDFIEAEGGGMELSVVNPVGIFGPALGKDLSTSIELVRRMMEGKLPGTPDLWFGVIDVRDVASLQLLAMTHPEARNERLLAVAGEPLSLHQMALILHDHMGTKVPRQLPSWLVRALALVNPMAREAVPRLGIRGRASNAKAKALGWAPRSNEEAVVATAQSLKDLKLA